MAQTVELVGGDRQRYGTVVRPQGGVPRHF
jgi:hypothetical protein